MKSRLYWELLDIATYVEDEGGFYSGMIRYSDGRLFALILSNHQDGTSTLPVCRKYTKKLETNSFIDGWQNSQAPELVTNHHPILVWVRSLEIGGYKDWHIPSVMELELLARYYKCRPATNTNPRRFPKSNKENFNIPPEIRVFGENPYSLPVGKRYSKNYPECNLHLGDQFHQNDGFNPSAYISSTVSRIGMMCMWAINFDRMSLFQVEPYSPCWARAIRRVLIEG